MGHHVPSILVIVAAAALAPLIAEATRRFGRDHPLLGPDGQSEQDLDHDD